MAALIFWIILFFSCLLIHFTKEITKGKQFITEESNQDSGVGSHGSYHLPQIYQ